MSSLGIPFRLPPLSPREEDTAPAAATSPGAAGGEDDSAGSSSSSGRGAETTMSHSASAPSPAGSTLSSGATGASGGVSASPKVSSTRTRTVKSRALFTPEDEMEKKPRGRNGGRPKGSGSSSRGRGRPRKVDAQPRRRRSGLQDLLEDEEAPPTDGAGRDAHRTRSRNASDGENRWDRIRAKFKLLLHKMRRDTHFLQVYQQDGWRSSGREKLKPTAELKKAEDRIKGVKAELRQVAQRLTEMNSGGFRWGAIQEDGEGNIEVDEILCTKCNLGDSDEHNDILLCDFEGCFRAYHQNCLSPPIKPGAFPEGEQDWFCWQCECLLDCLEMLDAEFQGEFTSWKDVFPDVEEGDESGAAGKEDVLLTDSDEDNDESFNGSSSESEEETTARRRGDRRPKGGDGESSGSDDDDGSSNDEDGSEDDSEDDSDAGWMSDAESVGADEVSKLYSEAGDLAHFDESDGDGEGTAEQAPTAEGDRGSRARARRGKRNAALGLGDDQNRREKREMAAALAGNAMDTANIVESRTRRKQTVDYVKLNEAVFGDESVDGDKLSSDEQADESSEASGGEASDASASPPRKKATPKRRSTPTIDPATGLPRKRGRPRKVPPAATAKDATGSFGPRVADDEWRVSSRPGPKPDSGRSSLSGRLQIAASPKPRQMPSIDPATGEKRKRGRPRKVPVVDETSAGGGPIVKRKRGRPRKSESDLLKRKSGAGNGAKTITPERNSGAASSCCSPPSPAENGYETNRGKGRARDPEDVIVIGDDSDEGNFTSFSGIPAIDYENMEADTAEVAAMAAAVAAKAEDRPATGSAATPIKRGRGRPPKTSTPSSAPVDSGGNLSAWNGPA